MKMTIKHLLVLGFASLMFLGCATSKHDDGADKPAKWEYRTEMLRLTDPEATARLNALNSQGWTIVSVTPQNGVSTYVFKRLKQ